MQGFKDVYFFIDDSGVFDIPENELFFCYCGYMIIGNNVKNSLMRKYTDIIKELKKEYPFDEIKGCIFDKRKNKELQQELRLYKCMKDGLCYKLIAEINNSRIYDYIRQSKRSKTRYKNYVIKLLVKNALEKAIIDHKILPSDKFNIHLMVDEEGVSTDGIYNLQETIWAELYDGIQNFDYGTFHRLILTNRLSKVNVRYCQSCQYTPIQSADILANLYYFFLREGYDTGYFKRKDNTIFKSLP